MTRQNSRIYFFLFLLFKRHREPQEEHPPYAAPWIPCPSRAEGDILAALEADVGSESGRKIGGFASSSDDAGPLLFAPVDCDRCCCCTHPSGRIPSSAISCVRSRTGDGSVCNDVPFELGVDSRGLTSVVVGIDVVAVVPSLFKVLFWDGTCVRAPSVLPPSPTLASPSIRSSFASPLGRDDDANGGKYPSSALCCCCTGAGTGGKYPECTGAPTAGLIYGFAPPEDPAPPQNAPGDIATPGENGE